jgi:hypothetical protein
VIVLSKLYNLVAVVAIGSLLALGGLGGYLAGAGHLNRERVTLLAAVVRGEHDDLLHPEPEPEADVATEPEEASGVRAADALRTALLDKQLTDARLDRVLSDIAARQQLLDQAVQELVANTEVFESRKQEWVEQRQRMLAADQDAGFQRELEYVESLQPRQAKEHLVRTWQGSRADAIRLLRQMPVNKGRRVLEEFKTPEELDLMNELLEQLRMSDLEEIAPASGKTAGGTQG